MARGASDWADSTNFYGRGTVTDHDDVLLPVDAHTDDRTIAGALSYAMRCRAVVRGSDIRVDHGTSYLDKVFPRVLVKMSRWRSRTLLSFQWKGS